MLSAPFDLTEGTVQISHLCGMSVAYNTGVSPVHVPVVCLLQCNAAVGVKAFFDMMHIGPHKVMLFGAACTQVTDPIAKASKRWHLTQVRYVGTYLDGNYPYRHYHVPALSSPLTYLNSLGRVDGNMYRQVCLFVFGATAPPPQWAKVSSFLRILDHTKRRIRVGRTPLY
jgi:hypothetical protein